MISLKTIHNRHFNAFLNNVPFTFLISSNSSKFMHLSSISRRPFSSSAQYAHIAEEKILNSTEPLSGFFRRVLGGGATTESNHVVAENSEEVRSLTERLRNLEEEVRNLKKERCETVKNLELSSKKSDPSIAPKIEKRSLLALFTAEKKGQSKSISVSESESKSKSKSESEPKSKSMSKSESEPESKTVKRTAYGVEDPMVHKELSSDMKMFVEHLYTKGYLKNANFMPRDKFDATCFEVSYAREFLKFAASNFGKDHPDIAGWLSAGDLKKVALFGCPSLGQRTIFAAKHMRKFFKIDEQKVCQTCTLKELCMHPNKNFAKPSTKLHLANVIKVLIMYSMESVPQKLVVPEEIKSSVSRLLREIISLSQVTS